MKCIESSYSTRYYFCGTYALVCIFVFSFRFFLFFYCCRFDQALNVEFAISYPIAIFSLLTVFLSFERYNLQSASFDCNLKTTFVTDNANFYQYSVLHSMHCIALHRIASHRILCTVCIEAESCKCNWSAYFLAKILLKNSTIYI